MKTRDSRMQLLRIAWLAVLAAGLVIALTFTTAVADGTTIAWPDNNDSTDSTDNYVAPDTTEVEEQAQWSASTTIFWELWYLLF